MRQRSLVLFLVAVLAGLAMPLALPGDAQAAKPAALVFSDVEGQTRTFIGYYHSIKLTRDQEAIKARALNSIPAPCCSDKPMRTCCCDCNLAKAVWGMSNYAVAKLGYTEEQLRDKTLEWLAFINPGGFTGDSCYTGRCGLPFDANGCGGMDESRLVVRSR
jgi:hypothetical protein